MRVIALLALFAVGSSTVYRHAIVTGNANKCLQLSIGSGATNGANQTGFGQPFNLEGPCPNEYNS